MLETILNPLRELDCIVACSDALQEADTPVFVSGLADCARAQFMSAVSDAGFKLIITYDEVRARQIVEDMKIYDKDTLYYPAKDLIFFSSDVHGQAITRERLSVIKRLTSDNPATIVTTIDGGMDACLPFDYYKKLKTEVKVGDILDLEEFTEVLVSMGYDNTGEVTREGEFSVRGGIIDVFPMTEECPYRIELWDDEIDSIRSIDVESQRSIEKVDSLEITPATEVMLTKDALLAGLHIVKQESEELVRKYKKEKKLSAATRLQDTINNFINTFEAYQGLVNIESYIRYFIEEEPESFFEYFNDKNISVFIDEPERVLERANTVEYEFRDSMKTRLEQGYILPKQSDILLSSDQVLNIIKKYNIICMSSLDIDTKSVDFKRRLTVNTKQAPSFNNNFALLVKNLKDYIKNKYRILVVSASETRGRRMVDDLMDYDVVSFYEPDKSHVLLPGEVMVTKGNIRHGFEFPDIKFVVLTESDIFGARRKRKRRKRYEGNAIHSFNDLKIGDYVVHENHGLGIYEGIEKIETKDSIKDYLKVSYAGGSNLYVPATSLEVLQKYADSDTKPPKLNKLGTKEWSKTKEKVRGAVDEVAKELVELYAKRSSEKGYAFEKDTVWQREFEEMFPYEETPDQLRAIEDTKSDMESTKIMDRLICGDVGFGKTEVAIRAAFKAVMDGKQVAMLVPTTILASQHYSTFAERMSGFGVNVGLLCRLRTAAEQRKTIEGLKSGKIDVVIGTHKLLGKTVEYKNLGLLIIDEEQRFGVKHKEKIKQLKSSIDVLTLTATPIPRTLHMSLIGIRDMSLLEEPPEDRLPIQTYVIEKSDEIAREAILRELQRGGQVYYIYNRVNNIEYVAGSIAELIPEAKVAYAHGQMSERELEDTMFAFIEGDIDVLVATTIVESGLDIPNVNTIIIEDADRFGLSQLYQLRGRVGRSGRSAYAFLMYKRDKMLKEVAEKRLEAIRQFTELGSGFRISMRDLELRGAGNILGTYQHGHVAAVGYDLYCKMLDNAIKKLKGEKTPSDEYETSIEIKVDAFIPVEYIKNEFQKLDIYKRIASVSDTEEKEDMLDELADRFGKPPKSVVNLLDIALIKARAHRAYITSIEMLGDDIILKMFPKAEVDPLLIPGIITSQKGDMKFVPERTITRRGEEVKLDPYFAYSIEGDLLERVTKAVELIEGIVAV